MYWKSRGTNYWCTKVPIYKLSSELTLSALPKRNHTKGCLSLFNYFIDMRPEVMSPFFVKKKHVFSYKNMFFRQKMDSLTRVSCL